MMWIIVIIVVVLIILLNAIKRSKRMMNPITSLTFDGTLGFRIGDSRAYTVSRISHLKLDTEKDKESKRLYKGFGLTKSSITSATNLFENIEDISFGFTMERLSNINITMCKPAIDESTFGRALLNQISRNLGNPISGNEKEALWGRRELKQYVCLKITGSMSLG